MRRLAAALLTPVLLVGLCACAPGPDAPSEATVDADTGYEGPEITLAEVGGMHAVRLFAPSGGWTAVRDLEQRERAEGRVRITLVRPDPEVMHLQALVEHELVTNIPASRPIAVLVRAVDHDANPDARPYVLARTAGPAR